MVRATNALDRRGSGADEYYFDPLGRPVEQPATQAQATVAIRIGAMAANPGELLKLRQEFDSLRLGRDARLSRRSRGLVSPTPVDFGGLTLIRQAEIHHRDRAG